MRISFLPSGVTSTQATRRSSGSGRRVAWVLPTPEGKKLIRTARRRGDEWLAKRLKTLSSAELAVLDRASQIFERLQAERDGP